MPDAFADWKPVGLPELEPTAWKALRRPGSASLVAGPGAGKTEFLAQRACFLLETDVCPHPKQILAISFKRDAAINLANRVRARAPNDSPRLVSLTFDAFTKGIVDRFRRSIPKKWQLHTPYDIQTTPKALVTKVLSDTAIANPASRDEIRAISPVTFMNALVGSHPLPAQLNIPTSVTELAVLSWWDQTYLSAPTQHVDFVTLNRLAELLIRSNDQIRRALRLTYPFVFVDEFQDTTYAQYSFLKAVFGQGATTVTVVGDNKQRIMGWAGAHHDAFSEFRDDFRAPQLELEWNFRATDELIAVQHIFAQSLDPSSKRAISKVSPNITDDPVAIWHFASVDAETRFVADWIANDVATSGRSPSEYALLVRQKASDFEERFTRELSRVGIRLRNEDSQVGNMKLQELLVDELGQFLIDVTRLAAAPGGNGPTWIRVVDTMLTLRGADGLDIESSAVVDRDLSAFLRQLRNWMGSSPATPDQVHRLADKIMTFVGVETIRRSFLSPRPEQDVVDAFASRMGNACITASSWREAADLYEDQSAVPLMTVHKSKGLEYHTVLFLGIDDEQWWAHKLDPQESIATFYVGMSRASQRTIFTYCEGAGPRELISDFYALLTQAGVPEKYY